MNIEILDSIKNTTSLRLLNLLVLVKSLKVESGATFENIVEHIQESFEFKNQNDYVMYSNQDNSILTFVNIENGKDLIKVFCHG